MKNGDVNTLGCIPLVNIQRVQERYAINEAGREDRVQKLK